MGAPKQKWTAAEEAALRAGIAKYGAGKWSTILKDPEFSNILHMRSNVDLKDKWRNMNVMASGLGSRHRARPVVRNIQPISMHDGNSKAFSNVVEGDTEVADAVPLAVTSGTLPDGSSKKPISRLDDHILEAITNLKEPRGSNRNAIPTYIEVKHKYRTAPSPPSFDMKKDPPSLLLDGKKDPPSAELNGARILTKAEIDAELERMKSMTAKEAAAAAAQAVAEAEAAIAAAEDAVKEAEDAERDAEAAKVFAEAAMKASKCRKLVA